MAINGTGVMDSDLAHDIYGEFMDLYDSEYPVADIRSRLEQWNPELCDDIEREIYLSVTCQALWEIGELTDEDCRRFQSFMENESAFQLWKELDEKACRQRRKVLVRQLAKLATPRAKSRKRKKHYTITKLLFEVGDCLSYEHPNGDFYGLIVREISQYRGDCLYQMVPIINESYSPTQMAFFNEGQFYGRKIWCADHPNGFLYGFAVTSPDHRDLVGFADQFETIGRITLNSDDSRVGSFGATMSKEGFDQDLRGFSDELSRGQCILFPVSAVVVI